MDLTYVGFMGALILFGNHENIFDTVRNRILINQSKSDYIYHFPIDLEPNEILFDSKSMKQSTFTSVDWNNAYNNWNNKLISCLQTFTIIKSTYVYKRFILCVYNLLAIRCNHIITSITCDQDRVMAPAATRNTSPWKAHFDPVIVSLFGS